MFGPFAAVRVTEMVFAFLSTIGIDPFGNRVAVNAEGFGGMRNAPLVPRVGFLNVELLELLERFIQKDVAVEHVFNDGF